MDARDSFRCRACRRLCRRTLALVADRWERHHIVSRSRVGRDTPENVMGCCRRCQDLIHVTRELHVEGNANVIGGLTFEQDGRTWKG